jgi:dynein heavy chain, axonemal
VFDTIMFEWSQPNAHLQAMAPKPSEPNKKPAWNNQPSPRGGHTASLIESKLWLFGGYGGTGYSRRDLDELYTLNVEKWVWSKVVTKGKPPEKRSNHTSVAVERKLYVFGGGNSVQQFRDLYILDTGESDWSSHCVRTSLAPAQLRSITLLRFYSRQ